MANYKQIKAIEAVNKDRLKRHFPNVDLRDLSGIYVFTRTDENGMKFAYIGQGKRVWTRAAQHLSSHKQYIDNSIYKHKLYSETNPYGWRLLVTYYCTEDRINEQERWWIAKMAEIGYQLHNKTAGGQDSGKVGIAPNAPSKGYHDGLKQGYANARKRIAPLFEKYLDVAIKDKPNKIKERALQKFLDFLSGEDARENDDE